MAAAVMSGAEGFLDPSIFLPPEQGQAKAALYIETVIFFLSR